MQLNVTTDYAIRTVMHLAARPGSYVSGKAICADTNIPSNYIHHIAHKLISGGILGSVKGQRGGYYLEKTPDQITLLDIVSIMEGPIRLERRDEDCADENAAMLAAHYAKIQQDICDAFAGVTIAQIMQQK